MDRQARKLATRGNAGGEDGATSDVGSELGSNTDSDSDEKVNYLFVCYFDLVVMLAVCFVKIKQIVTQSMIEFTMASYNCFFFQNG